MKNISIVQVIIFGIAGVAILVAVLYFAFNKGGSNSEAQLSSITIWGTVPEELVNTMLVNINQTYDDKLRHVSYVEYGENVFQKELVNALAEGTGPDLIFLRENQIIENENKLKKIPYSFISLRNFQDTFIEEGNLLITNDGLIGLPINVDPLVLFYNTDPLNSAGIARPPQTWTDLLSIVPELTNADTSFNISKTAIALGDYANIQNAKEIIWALVMQAGNDVVSRNSSKDFDSSSIKYFSIFSNKSNYSVAPSYAASNFYSQFSNPNKTIYSWNRSLPNSDDFFLAGNSTFYLGFASELPKIKQKNPNLNFEVAEIPQAKDSVRKATYGKMNFVAITNGAKDLNSAFQTALILSSKEVQAELSRLSGLPSVRRDLILEIDPTNSLDIIFSKSALYARGVMEPNSQETNGILLTMMRTIISGENTIDEAINKVNDKLNQLIK